MGYVLAATPFSGLLSRHGKVTRPVATTEPAIAAAVPAFDFSGDPVSGWNERTDHGGGNLTDGLCYLMVTGNQSAPSSNSSFCGRDFYQSMKISHPKFYIPGRPV
jgi:hypothetical protein